VAILHTLYSIYHLGRRASGRTPASSASYMLFAAAFDVSVIPFYAFSALESSAQYKLAQTGTGKDGQWSSLLPAGQTLMPILSGTAFLCSVIAGGLHVISLGLSLWLAVTFRKITKLPPDMNPLEDNLTSRHKRNKSSMSVSTTISEKRISEPLESKRKSGAPYEELARPPTIPFFHTRQGSTESFSTYNSTPPGSRDSRLDLPSRQYQIQSNSPRTSIVDLKRASYHAPISPAKRATYTEVPLSETASQRSSRQGMGNLTEAWYTADSLPASKTNRATPHKAAYHPLFNNKDEEDDITSAVSTNHPNPLEANPPTPRLNEPTRKSPRKSALSEISLNQSAVSQDLADQSRQQDDAPEGKSNQFKSKFYGELRAATPPVMIGSANGRQVSSGTDFPAKKGFKGFGKRDVSGKVAEEGRGGASGSWGARFRKVSGK
jgi:hypothetical protein